MLCWQLNSSTMVAPKEVSVAAAMALVISDLGSIFRRQKAFLYRKGVFILFFVF